MFVKYSRKKGQCLFVYILISITFVARAQANIKRSHKLLEVYLCYHTVM